MIMAQRVAMEYGLRYTDTVYLNPKRKVLVAIVRRW